SLTVGDGTNTDDTTGTVVLLTQPGNFYALVANAMDGEVQIRYGVPVKTQAEILLYNVNGQLVRRLMSEELSVGEHSISWNLKDDKGLPVSPGVYFLHLRASEGHAACKVVIAR
ncbi:T9SS type A sorting domain-containing protein, partial [candidate division WOR-3 bacterium]|nr:T9SS type A sorting domain-containing protein [candidate division WOR-3 bacterium]